MGDNKAMVEWVTDSTIHADGFWNPKTVGSKVHGILLLQRLVDGSGKKILNPFYIFELVEPATSDVFIDKKPVAKIDAGKYIGLNCWKRLSGITRKLGFEFELTYLGRVRLNSGKPFVNLRIRCGTQQVREVERMSPALLDEGDGEEAETT